MLQGSTGIGNSWSGWGDSRRCDEDLARIVLATHDSRTRVWPAPWLLFLIILSWLCQLASTGVAQPQAEGGAGERYLRTRYGWLVKIEPSLCSSTQREAVEGKGFLAQAGGLIQDGRIAQAIEILIPLVQTDGRGSACSRQEANFYLGGALQRSGLPLLAVSSYARVVLGPDPDLVERALFRIGEIERQHAGAQLLIDLPPAEVTARAPAELRERFDLSRARDLLRVEDAAAREEALAVLATIPLRSKYGVQAGLLLATHQALTSPDQARSTVAQLLELPLDAGDADRSALLLLAGRLQYGAAHLPEALGLLRQVPRGAPEARVAQLAEASTLLRLSRPGDSLRLLFDLSRAQPGTDDPDQAGLAHPGEYILAALIYLEACAIEKAEALLELALRDIEPDLSVLRAFLTAHAEEDLVTRLRQAESIYARQLLLDDQDEWLLRLHEDLNREGAGLEEQSAAHPLARSIARRILQEDHRNMRRLFERRSRAMLARRVEWVRQALQQWLWLALSLRDEALQQQHEALFDYLRTGTQEGLFRHRGTVAWSFELHPWKDPDFEKDLLPFERCPLPARDRWLTKP